MTGSINSYYGSKLRNGGCPDMADDERLPARSAEGRSERGGMVPLSSRYQSTIR